METKNAIELAKSYYAAFARGDRNFIEQHLAEDFSFSAPPDPMLDRSGYFERCWPGAGKNQQFDIKRAITYGDEVIVTYEMHSDDGSKGRNTEIITIVEDKIVRIEVYFGWKL